MIETSPTIVETTISAIREAIRAGHFAPGQRLVVADLQRIYGISAGPVREAIRRLTGEGLIEFAPHRGAVVRAFTSRDVRDYFEVREGIESVAARLAAENVHHGDYGARITQVIEALRKATADGADLAVARQAFHTLLYEMSGNRRLAELGMQLTYPMLGARYRSLLPDRAKASLAEHEEIAGAILAGDGAAAERLMRRHLRNAAASIREAMEADPEFQHAFFGKHAK